MNLKISSLHREEERIKTDSWNAVGVMENLTASGLASWTQAMKFFIPSLSLDVYSHSSHDGSHVQGHNFETVMCCSDHLCSIHD